MTAFDTDEKIGCGHLGTTLRRDVACQPSAKANAALRQGECVFVDIVERRDERWLAGTRNDRRGNLVGGRPIGADNEGGSNVRVRAEPHQLRDMSGFVRAKLSATIRGRSQLASRKGTRNPARWLGDEPVDAEHQQRVADAGPAFRPRITEKAKCGVWSAVTRTC